MNKVGLCRRRFLLFAGKLCGFAGLAFVNGALAQVPQPPGGMGGEVDDPTKKKIRREVYERWLRDVQDAARNLAEKSGANIQQEDINLFKRNAEETLENNGYQVPNPPTNLRVD